MVGTSPLAEYFDGWYADMAGSSVQHAIQEKYLGLPPGLLSTSLLTWEGIAEVVSALQLPSGGLLIDLACGRGGYGLEIARRTSTRLIGVDFAEQALVQARRLARQARQTAEFRCADYAATGLQRASADAVLCVDAIQFAEPPGEVFTEIRRLLKPRGRVVLTCWEPVDRNDERVPERLRRLALADGLAAAGFVDVVVRARPEWREAERRMWEAAAALDPGEDPALISFHDEGVRAQDLFDRLDRLLATASAPDATGPTG